jgi:hypothetical protein
LPENSAIAGGAVAADSGRVQQVASARPDLPSPARSLNAKPNIHPPGARVSPDWLNQLCVSERECKVKVREQTTFNTIYDKKKKCKIISLI